MKLKHRLLNLVCVSALLSLAAMPAFATTRSVPSAYSTIQAAINAAASGDTISIASGTYNEQDTVPSTLNNVTFVGASQTGVILQAGSGQTALTVHGTNITFEYMTIQNTLQSGSESSHAVYVDSARVEFYRCYIIGWQDTFAIWNNAVVYCNLSEIRGEEDFIYSGGTAFFNSCNIREMSTAGGDCNCAPSTPSTVTYGFVFSGCTICRGSGVPTNSDYLMRPWGANGETAYISCSMDSHITAVGWLGWGTNQDTCRAAEYGSTTLSGTTISLSERASWVVRLTSTQAATYSKANVLGGWTPPL
jgi:pectinesterase